MGSANVTLYAVWIPNNYKFSSSGTNIRITGYTTAPTGSLSIPCGVTSIGAEVFNGCTSLLSVTVQSTVPPSLDSSGTFLGKASEFQIHVPTGTVSTYQAAQGWSAYASEIVSPLLSSSRLRPSSEKYRFITVSLMDRFASARRLNARPSSPVHSSFAHNTFCLCLSRKTFWMESMDKIG